MPNKLSSTAIEALRSTLEKIEKQSGLTADDSALLELKRILLGRIAELEATEGGIPLAGSIPELLDSLPTHSDANAASTLGLDLAVSLVAGPHAISGPPESLVEETLTPGAGGTGADPAKA